MFRLRDTVFSFLFENKLLSCVLGRSDLFSQLPLCSSPEIQYPFSRETNREMKNMNDGNSLIQKKSAFYPEALDVVPMNNSYKPNFRPQ